MIPCSKSFYNTALFLIWWRWAVYGIFVANFAYRDICENTVWPRLPWFKQQCYGSALRHHNIFKFFRNNDWPANTCHQNKPTHQTRMQLKSKDNVQYPQQVLDRASQWNFTQCNCSQEAQQSSLVSQTRMLTVKKFTWCLPTFKSKLKHVKVKL